jgi:hypothetical protein
MFEHFVLRHLPPLFIATTVTFGGTMPFYNPEKAILTFGFPPHIAATKAAWPVMACGSARVSVMGIALWGMYLGNHLEAMDILFASMGWLVFVDGYVCWKDGAPGSVMFRTICAGLVATWGLLGMTAGR